MRQGHLTAERPAQQIPRFVAPGELTLDCVSWGHDGALAVGRVGDERFRIEVATSDLLDRRRFIRQLWRFKHLLGVLPHIDRWNEMLAKAERRSA